MKFYYKGVLSLLSTYRVMGEDRPALYPVGSPDFDTLCDAGFAEMHYGLWAKVLSDEEYQDIVNTIMKNE